LAAFWVALGGRDAASWFVHHSDRGSQYSANDYRGALNARGVAVTMSRHSTLGVISPAELEWRWHADLNQDTKETS
jgi:putative transposase